MPVTLQMQEIGDLSLTPSYLEEDNDRRKYVKESADDASSQGSVEHKTKNSVACSGRVSRSDVKESSGSLRRLQANAENEATTRPNKATEDDTKSVRSNVSSRTKKSAVGMSECHDKVKVTSTID